MFPNLALYSDTSKRSIPAADDYSVFDRIFIQCSYKQIFSIIPSELFIVYTVYSTKLNQ